MTRGSGSDPDGVALADTSVFIAHEQVRPVSSRLPERLAVSVVTVGELRLGVLAAGDGATRAQRLETLSKAEELDPLPVDALVAHAWATLRLALRDAGLRMPINDSWIAATAIAHSMLVATQDGDYDGIPGVEVLRL
ncbi:MAG TPA: type II toxin-antitoxin system VapC family toxin [Acidimicrobiales bacterium]|nr:type II toxin-antitoxin system VapC family toxin [Acidimicrobiales bacterium]